MKTLISTFILTASCVALGGWQSRVAAHPGHDHDAEPTTETAGTDEHEHGMVEIPANQPIPTVNVIAHPDSLQGWNLEVQTTNFQFAPEHVNEANKTSVAGQIVEGHAHLYIDGVKITRLYGNWYYLESLAPGKHQITVGLNTNDHNMLMHHGQPLQATVVVDVPVTAK